MAKLLALRYDFDRSQYDAGQIH